MKNIEEIKKEKVKKILAKKKYLIFLQEILLKLVSEFLKEKGRGFNISKGYVLQKKIVI